MSKSFGNPVTNRDVLPQKIESAANEARAVKARAAPKKSWKEGIGKLLTSAKDDSREQSQVYLESKGRGHFVNTDDIQHRNPYSTGFYSNKIGPRIRQSATGLDSPDLTMHQFHTHPQKTAVLEVQRWQKEYGFGKEISLDGKKPLVVPPSIGDTEGARAKDLKSLDGLTDAKEVQWVVDSEGAWRYEALKDGEGGFNLGSEEDLSAVTSKLKAQYDTSRGDFQESLSKTFREASAQELKTLSKTLFDGEVMGDDFVKDAFESALFDIDDPEKLKIIQAAAKQFGQEDAYDALITSRQDYSDKEASVWKLNSQRRAGFMEYVQKNYDGKNWDKILTSSEYESLKKYYGKYWGVKLEFIPKDKLKDFFVQQ